MPTLGWIGLVVVWIWMSRLCIRWSLETSKEPASLGSEIFICTILWWIGIPVMLGERKKRKEAVYGKRAAISDDTVRRFVGESKWHKQERLNKQHKKNLHEVGMDS